MSLRDNRNKTTTTRTATRNNCYEHCFCYSNKPYSSQLTISAANSTFTIKKFSPVCCHRRRRRFISQWASKQASELSGWLAS